MATADSSSIQNEEVLNCIQSNHDEAFLYISQGLSYQEQNEYELACDMYNKGLEKLNEALNVRCDRPYCVGPKWDKARRLQQKMRKTLQMAKTQLENLSRGNFAAKDISPPSYDEACGGLTFFTERRSSCPSAASKTKAAKRSDCKEDTVQPPSYSHSCNGSADNVVSEVKEIFGISDGVQLFFVSASDSVSTWSSTSSLHVYKFVNNTQQAKSTNESLPSGWLQVGGWTYPLVPGQSPALESGYGAFLFPDITNKQDGAAVAVILPASIDLETRNIFKKILDQLTVLHEEEHFESGTLEQESFSDTLSRGIVTGAEYLSAGLVKGASVTGDYIHKGAVMLRERIQPESRPMQIDPNLQQGLRVAKNASTVALKVTGFLAGKLCDLTIALGNKLAPHIREQGTRLLTSTFDKNPDDAKHTVDSVMKVAAGGLQGFSTVYMGLHNAASLLAVSLSTETVNTVDYKYGSEAGEAVGNAVSAVGNLALTTSNVRALGPKSIAKRTAKDAGKAVLQDYVKLDETPEKPPK